MDYHLRLRDNYRGGISRSQGLHTAQLENAELIYEGSKSKSSYSVLTRSFGTSSKMSQDSPDDSPEVSGLREEPPLCWIGPSPIKGVEYTQHFVLAQVFICIG